MFWLIACLAVAFAISDAMKRKKRKSHWKDNSLMSCLDDDDSMMNDRTSLDDSMDKYGTLDMDMSNSTDSNPMNH